MTSLSGIRYGDQISAAAQAHGLDPKLLAAVAAQETGGPGSDSGNNIVGDGGHGHGLFQIDDRSWAFASTPAAMDPAANANAAAGILSDDLNRYGGDVHAALSAYNSGSPTAQGTTTTWGDGATLGYADSVMRHYAALGGDPAQLAADTRAGTAGTSLATLGAATPFLTGAAGTALPTGAATALQTGAAADVLGTAGETGVGTSTSAASAASPYGMLTPPTIQTTTQSPFAAPVSWASETSANGPAGGKEAADADSLVADSIDASDDALDDHNDS
jgi:hypothetical protein